MDAFTLNKLEFDQVRAILSRYCRCSLGRELALRIGPSRRPEMARTWLAQTTEMVATLIDHGPPPLGGVTDIRDAMARAVPSGGATGDDFNAIAATLEGSANVLDWLATLPEERTALAALGEALSRFDGEVSAIREIIDERGDLRDTASSHLAAIRRESDSCVGRIREIVYGFVRRADVSPYLQSTSVQLHEDRYVLPVRSEQRGRVKGVVHRASGSGATIFVEPAECVALNNRLVQLADDERAEVARILNQLAMRVHSRAAQVKDSLYGLGMIDLVTAKAEYSYQFEMHCPELTERGRVMLVQARHPLLLEHARRQDPVDLPPERRHPVVPIDVRLGDDFDLLVITGSNTGGKTVAMKTVGLLAVMAQAGLHIPTGRGSTLPVFRDVLMDVGDEQSLQQSLSTFSGHLKRIRSILGRADRYCLVLLDELGAGTDPDEGGAIGQAVLDELRTIGCLAMVTTHLSVLKAYAFNHERVDNASVEFDVKTLQPTYRMHIGRPGESHAIAVAQRLGLPKRLVSAARKHLPRQHAQLRKAIEATAESRAASESARTEAEAAAQQARQRKETYEAKLDELDRLSKQFGEWISSLPAMQAGDEVFVRRLNKAGRLVRLQLSRQVAVVHVDRKDVEVPLQELMPEMGDPLVRQEIATLRRQIAEQARRSQAALEDAERRQQEYHQSAQRLQHRLSEFEHWQQQLAALRVGDEVTFGPKPGWGRVVEMDIPGGKVTVESPGRDAPIVQTIAIQELFCERGPRPGAKPAPGRRGDASAKDEAKPVRRRRPDSKAGRANQQAMLKLEPGAEVYVIPFRKTAHLVRIDEEKQLAVVTSGAFEMQVPLADVKPSEPDKAKRKHPPKTKDDRSTNPPDQDSRLD